MKRILVILANSRKKGGRCIAGIDVETGEWIRRCWAEGDRGIEDQWVDQSIEHLLDIVEIPLESDGPNRELQPENRRIIQGPPWKRRGRATLAEIQRYCQPEGPLLYNTCGRIHPSEIRSACATGVQPSSLALIRPSLPVHFFTRGTPRGKRVQAVFDFGGNRYQLRVTDYIFEKQFPPYHTETKPCLLAVSLAMPFERDGYCYKLVAGVIPLSEGQS